MEQLIQQPTQLTDQNFNVEGWMLIGAGIAICLAIILLIFFNKLFTKKCIQEEKPAVKKAQHTKQPNASNQKAKIHKAQAVQEGKNAKQSKVAEEAEQAKQLKVTQKAHNTQKEVEKVVARAQNTKEIAAQMSEGIEINLVEVNDLSKHIRFYLKNELILGRNPQKSQVIIGDDPTVSSKHCKFYVFDDKVYLMDLGSTNGTFVNDKLIEYAVVLNVGDKIAIGARKYYVRW